MISRFFNTIEKITPIKWRWVWSHEGFRRYFSNTGWMFFGQIFNLVLSFFVGIWIIRYLGPENYGIISYALAFTLLFMFIANLGIDSILKRELINFPEKRDQLLGTAFRLKLLGGLMALVLAIAFIFLIEASVLIRGLVSLYSFIFLLQSINIIKTFFDANVEAKKGVYSQVIASSISSILKIVLILSGSGIIWLMLIYLLDSLWMAISLVYFYKKSGLKIRNWSFKMGIAKKMFSDSWLLALTSVSVLIYMKIDQVMIKQMLGEASVGFYAAAVRLIEYSYIIPTLICASLSPAIFNARKVSLSSYSSRLKKLSFLLFLISAIIAVPISIFSKFIVNILFGSEYYGSVMVLNIGVWSIVGVSILAVVGQYLIAENYVKIYFFVTLIGAIVNIVLNYFMIPIWGIGGAAAVSVFSYLLVPFSLIFFKETRRGLGFIFRN